MKVREMQLHFIPMNIDFVHIIQQWKYVGFMESINMDAYETYYEQYGEATRGPGNCFGFVAMEQDNIIGLFEYYPQMNQGVEIGLALAPGYVGKGLSKSFILEGIAFGISFGGWDPNEVRLDVETNNLAAYHAYLKAGFIPERMDANLIHMHWVPSSHDGTQSSF